VRFSCALQSPLSLFHCLLYVVAKPPWPSWIHGSKLESRREIPCLAPYATYELPFYCAFAYMAGYK
jgi:hypothetical protein